MALANFARLCPSIASIKGIVLETLDLELFDMFHKSVKIPYFVFHAVFLQTPSPRQRCPNFQLFLQISEDLPRSHDFPVSNKVH